MDENNLTSIDKLCMDYNEKYWDYINICDEISTAEYCIGKYKDDFKTKNKEIEKLKKSQIKECEKEIKEIENKISSINNDGVESDCVKEFNKMHIFDVDTIQKEIKSKLNEKKNKLEELENEKTQEINKINDEINEFKNDIDEIEIKLQNSSEDSTFDAEKLKSNLESKNAEKIRSIEDEYVQTKQALEKKAKEINDKIDKQNEEVKNNRNSFFPFDLIDNIKKEYKEGKCPPSVMEALKEDEDKFIERKKLLNSVELFELASSIILWQDGRKEFNINIINPDVDKLEKLDYSKASNVKLLKTVKNLYNAQSAINHGLNKVANMQFFKNSRIKNMHYENTDCCYALVKFDDLFETIRKNSKKTVNDLLQKDLNTLQLEIGKKMLELKKEIELKVNNAKNNAERLSKEKEEEKIECRKKKQELDEKIKQKEELIESKNSYYDNEKQNIEKDYNTTIEEYNIKILDLDKIINEGAGIYLEQLENKKMMLNKKIEDINDNSEVEKNQLEEETNSGISDNEETLEKAGKTKLKIEKDLKCIYEKIKDTEVSLEECQGSLTDNIYFFDSDSIEKGIYKEIKIMEHKKKPIVFIYENESEKENDVKYLSDFIDTMLQGIYISNCDDLCKGQVYFNDEEYSGTDLQNKNLYNLKNNTSELIEELNDVLLRNIQELNGKTIDNFNSDVLKKGKITFKSQSKKYKIVNFMVPKDTNNFEKFISAKLWNNIEKAADNGIFIIFYIDSNQWNKEGEMSFKEKFKAIKDDCLVYRINDTKDLLLSDEYWESLKDTDPLLQAILAQPVQSPFETSNEFAIPEDAFSNDKNSTHKTSDLFDSDEDIDWEV